MIARIWHGKVNLENANEFFGYIKQTGYPGLKETEGNCGVQILRRDEEGISHFLIISFWDSMKAIRRFTGPDFTKARLYPRDSQFLHEIEQVMHYDVLIND